MFRNPRRSLALIVLALTLPALPAHAELVEADDLPEDLDFKRTVAERGPFFKMLFPSGGSATYAVGGSGVRYFGDHFYFGGRGWGGMVGGNGGMGFGGAVVGGGSQIGDWLTWHLDATLGGGGGAWLGFNGGGFVGIEPTLGIGLRFAEGARVDLNAGYLLASDSGFSGPTVGLKVGFKTVTYSATVPADSETFREAADEADD